MRIPSNARICRVETDMVIIFVVFFPFQCHCAINARFNKTEAQNNCVRIHLVVFVLLHIVSMFQISRKSYMFHISRKSYHSSIIAGLGLSLERLWQILNGVWLGAGMLIVVLKSQRDVCPSQQSMGYGNLTSTKY